MSEDKMPRSKEISDETILKVIRSADDPVVTTPEISEQLPMTRQGVAKRLRQLADEGRVNRKKPNRDVFYWLSCS